MGHTYFTNSHDLMSALGETMNLINPVVESHHEQVAYLSFRLACEMGLSDHEHLLTVVAGLLHDVGALFAEEQSQTLSFEKEAHTLARAGAEMMEDLPFFNEVADIVRNCQRPFRFHVVDPDESGDFPIASSIVHLADRVSLCLDQNVAALNQRDRLLKLVDSGRTREFCPDTADAFISLADQELMWMDLLYKPHCVMDLIPQMPLSLQKTAELTTLISRLIDYRSSFTAMHSAGVSASALRLAELIGMSDDECQMMEIAGNLHDLGKIRTPKAILEKPGKLTDEEFNIIKEHAYFTWRILKEIDGFDRICEWAALHHEKLNGRGYPFKMSGRQIPLGSRIMAVADIFSAITEERPYRAGMTREQTIRVMRENVETGALSPSIVELLLDNFDDVNEHREAASRIEGRRYFEAMNQTLVA